MYVHRKKKSTSFWKAFTIIYFRKIFPAIIDKNRVHMPSINAFIYFYIYYILSSMVNKDILQYNLELHTI